MLTGRLLLAQQRRCIIPRVLRTTNALERMRGLLGRAPLRDEEALLIKPCSSVHTLLMRYPLDLVYVSRNWTICKLVSSLRPWRVSACPGAAMVIEMNAGRINALGLRVGQQLHWEN